MTTVDTLSEGNLLALTGENALEDIQELTLRNHKLQTFEGVDTARLINLQVMSLSHNMVTSLAGFQHLKNLVSVNLNFNALTNLDGIGHCTALQHLFVANNRVRDASPLASCVHLQTLHLFRNNIANLDMALAALLHLPKLTELELAGNPCAMTPNYKHRVVLQLELESLDGDTINQLDYELANEFFATNGGLPPGVGPRVDILTLEDVDGSSGAVAGGFAAGVSDSGAEGDPGDASATSATGTTCRPGSGRDTAPAAQPSSSSGGGGGNGAEANGRAPPATAWVPLPRPGTAASRSIPAGPSGALLRPGTAAFRPGSSNGRPGSAYVGAQSSVQLLSNEILNDHPLILEYLAKHVLMEGLALADAATWGPGGGGGGSGGGRPGSGGGGGGERGAGRGPSFAQRLRDTAASMNACEDVDTKTLAGAGTELIATSATVRRGMAEEMVASAGPNELCRQLVRLCEVLIKEVEACRAGRPQSAGPAVGRPGTAMGARPMTPGLSAAAGASFSAGSSGGLGGGASSTLTSAEAGELVHLRAEVTRLCRENKSLRLENANMDWLVEEVKRLKGDNTDKAGTGAA